MATYSYSKDRPVSVSIKKVDSININDSSVEFTITNNTSKAIYVADRFTPFGDLYSDMFQLKKENSVVKYIGKIARFAPVTQEEFRKIESNDSINIVVDLSKHYMMIDSGKYSVQFDSQILFKTENNFKNGLTDYEKIDSRSNTLEFSENTIRDIDSYINAESKSNGFNRCSESQNEILEDAYERAEENSIVRSDAVHKLWFGTGSKERVKTVIEATEEMLPDSKGDCSCTDPGLYGYVYPNDKTHTIYVCGAFWNQPDTGKNTKAATIVHEATHFYDVGGTKDHVYGYEQSKKLARTSPQKAIECAENYTWYSEGHTD